MRRRCVSSFPRPTRLSATAAAVADLVALAPILGERNPRSVRTVIRIVRDLITQADPLDGPRLAQCPLYRHGRSVVIFPARLKRTAS